MESLSSIQKYLRQIKENEQQCIELSNEKYPHGMTKDELIEFIHNKSEKTRLIIRNNQDLIRNKIKPLLDEPEINIDEKTFNELFDSAQEFFNLFSHFDIGFAFNIYSALLKYAEATKDDDKIICARYWKGLALIYIRRELFTEKIKEIFQKTVDEYYDKYFELNNKTTRQYFNRSFGNLYLAFSISRTEDDYDEQPFLEQTKRCFDFWNDEQVRALDPDLPFDAYIMNMRMNTMVFTDYVRVRHEKNLPINSEIVKKIYEDSLAVYEWVSNDEKHRQSVIYPRAICSLAISKYYNNMIDIHQLCDELYALHLSAADNVYTSENGYRVCFASAIYAYFMELDDRLDNENKNERIKQITTRVLAYIADFPASASNEDINSSLTMFIVGFSSKRVTVDYNNMAFHIVLKLTIYKHMPTYVHSVMVAKLSVAICNKLIEVNPELFVGMDEIDSVSKVVEKKEMILEKMYKSGFVHDIGKIIYLKTLSNYARALNDEEFSVIKEHPNFGRTLISVDSQDNYCGEVACGHHKWYDGTRGYPEDYDNTKSQYKTFIDIVSVADSIDAATDTTGRGYAKGLSLQQITQELREQSGTRYSPYIAKLFDSEEFFCEIDDLINNERRDVYYDIYKNMYDKVETGSENDFISTLKSARR